MSRSLRLFAFIPAPPSAVYQAWLDGKQHAAMTGARATSQAREGGKFTAWDGYIVGKHEELIPPHRIVQSWRTTEFPEDCPDSRLEVEFEPEAGGTRLTLIQSSLPPGEAGRYQAGWQQFYFEPIQRYFARLGFKSESVPSPQPAGPPPRRRRIVVPRGVSGPHSGESLQQSGSSRTQIESTPDPEPPVEESVVRRAATAPERRATTGRKPRAAASEKPKAAESREAAAKKPEASKARAAVPKKPAVRKARAAAPKKPAARKARAIAPKKPAARKARAASPKKSSARPERRAAKRLVRKPGKVAKPSTRRGSKPSRTTPTKGRAKVGRKRSRR
jgi:uncharacterized protein YndB with AHSA1/START domain